jgi:hypothetical protein
MMKWYENHRHDWSYCHGLRFWISFYFLCGWEAVEYGEIPPFCVYAICHRFIKICFICSEEGITPKRQKKALFDSDREIL